MKSRSIFAFAVSVIMLIGLSACSNNVTQSDMSAPPSQSPSRFTYMEKHMV